eukprot:1333989-Pyramimonas_sp.AAC.1
MRSAVAVSYITKVQCASVKLLRQLRKAGAPEKRGNKPLVGTQTYQGGHVKGQGIEVNGDLAVNVHGGHLACVQEAFLR